MSPSRLTSDQMKRFHDILLAARVDAERHRAVLDESMNEVQTARSEGGDDDEHDPEGPTMAQEWSSLVGLTTSANEEIEVIDEALGRINNGSYGMCTHCGKPIGAARLHARPAAQLCIECARAKA